MAELYNNATSTTLTNLVESCEVNQELNQVVNYSRSGKMYMQILGDPKISYSVVCYAKREEVTNIESAWALGQLIKITISHGTYYGIIYEYNKNPVVDKVNMVFDGSENAEYFKIELKLGYCEEPSSSSSSSSSNGSSGGNQSESTSNEQFENP